MAKTRSAGRGRREKGNDMAEIQYANIVLPIEFIVYESKKSFGIQYSYRKDDGTYEDCIIFIPQKFKKTRGHYEVKIGLIRT